MQNNPSEQFHPFYVQDDTSFDPFSPRPSSTMSTADPIPDRFRPQNLPLPDPSLPSWLDFPGPWTIDNDPTGDEVAQSGSIHGSLRSEPDQSEETSDPSITLNLYINTILWTILQTIEEHFCEPLQRIDKPVFLGEHLPETGYCLATSLAACREPHSSGDRYGTNTHYNSFTCRFEITRQSGLSACAATFFGRQWERFGFTGQLTEIDNSRLRLLDENSGTKTFNFVQPYEGSFQEPTLKIISNGQMMPRVVFESKWYTSEAHIEEDVCLWLYGGHPNVQVFIPIWWSFTPNGAVKGIIRVYKVGKGYEEKVLFPDPGEDRRQDCVSFWREDLFGYAVPAVQSSRNKFCFFLNEFRCLAEQAIREEGFVLAYALKINGKLIRSF